MALCAAMVCLLCGCARRQPDTKALTQKLIGHFEAQGFACALSEPLGDGRDVPIADAAAWRVLTLDGQEDVLVYFDESNRADYLSARVDGERYGGVVTRYGLRFVLWYPGSDAGVIRALESIQND